MHPRPFLRTASKCQLNASCGYGSPHPPVVEVKGAPQHVVIGFNLGAEKSSRRTDVCESPRSVLEPGALCVSEQSRSPRSPRSVLGSLLSGHESHSVHTEGVGLGVVPAAIKAEEVRVSKFSSQATGKSNPIAISEQSEGICARRQSVAKSSFAMHESDFYGGIMMDGEYDDLDVDEDHVTGHNESIFCAASPFSTCCSLELPGCDFLSACFFCKCRLTHGKDVYMYKGDKAFCSMECRYQQIVLDEFRERQSAAASCFMGASTRSSNMLGGVYAAVA